MSLTTIQHYRLEEMIGRGGMGEVFRAFDTRLQRPVAIKLMRDTAGEAGLLVHRFLREARAASALNHPNIVVVHDIGETPEGRHYIVQEFINGETLRAKMTAEIPVESICDIGRQVARALGAAHATGIVHRDIKPENVMIRADGYVKVLDFGLARVSESAPSSATTHAAIETTPGILLGTMAYMSPEQARGEPAGAPADVFALGITLYEMAAGRRPFVAPSMAAVLTAILLEEPVSLCRLNPSILADFENLVNRMLAKNPSIRPTAVDVEEQLAALATGEPRTTSFQRGPMIADRRTVGREGERKRMRAIYNQVRDGQGRIVTVLGEPGIGKTVLIEDFLAELALLPERPFVVRGRCSERLAGAEAYLPVLEALDNLLHSSSGVSVHTLIKSIAPTWYVQVAHAATSQDSLARVREEAAAVSQERMKRELGALLQEASRLRPFVLFLDDLHWADVSTIDMLNYLGGRLDQMRLLVLATYRLADMTLGQHPFLGIRGELASHGALDEISLAFLDRRDVERYLSVMFPQHRFPNSLAELIHAKTEGSPLFMADVVRYLRDSGSIVERDEGWVLARSEADAFRELPASIRSMIARKIERLDETDRKLLVAASTQGHEFDSTVVAAAIEMDPAEVEERLSALEYVHVFVKRIKEHEFPDLALSLQYQFVHVLYQNALYGSLQPTRRASLSGRVARSLVGHYRDEHASIAGRLGALFEVARDFGPSAQYFLEGSRHAVGLFAFREALSLADRGLTVLRGMPEGPERLQHELGLQMVRGLALRMMKGWASPEIEPVFARARELCHQLGDAPELFPVLWAITLFHAIKGDLREYRARADDLMTEAERSGIPAFVMAAHHTLGVCLEFEGDMPRSSRILDRGRELHDPEQHRAYTAMFGLDPGMIARAMSSRPLWILGYPDRAEARARETLQLARSQRQPMTLVFALLVTQGVHLVRGEAAEALTIGDEVVALCREYGLPQEREWSRSFQGASLAALGRLDEGIAMLSDSLSEQQAIGAGLVRSAFLGVLADLLRFAGRVEDGLRAVEEGFAYAERSGEGGYLAELHRAKAELIRVQGDTAAAEASFAAAIEYARGQQARAFELRAATGLAQLLFASGRSTEARSVLEPVYNWFTEGLQTADLLSARATLDRAGQSI
jgi:predicted ATPase/type II secretory pathway predicted ATPase ExeA